MSFTVETMKKVVDRLPFESTIGNIMAGFEAKGWLDSPMPLVSGFNEASIDAAIKLLFRAAAAYFIAPHMSKVSAIYNISVGSVYLAIGFRDRFKTVNANTGPWNEIAKNLHTGFLHLTVAVYDFAIGYLMKVRYIGLFQMALFMLVPHVTMVLHQCALRKPTEPLTEFSKKLFAVWKEIPSLFPLVKNYFSGKPLDEQSAENLARLFEIINPPPEQNPPEKTDEKKPSEAPPPKSHPKEIERDCALYQIAKRITLELMPAPESIQQLSKVQRLVTSLRRVSGFGTGDDQALPGYGL